MNKTLLGISCLIVMSANRASANGWDYNDYQSIVGAGHMILGTKPAQQRKAAEIRGREVVRLMTELGLSGGKFIAFAGEDSSDPIIKRKMYTKQKYKLSTHKQMLIFSLPMLLTF